MYLCLMIYFFDLFQVHRLVIVDAEDRVSGVVSLSDILTYLVLRLEGKRGEFFVN